MKLPLRSLALGLALALLGGCATAGVGARTAEDAGPAVVVSSYPVEFIASRIAAADAEVMNVVPAGAEPHDIELTPRDVFTMDLADLTVTVSGFQPAVDAATREMTGVLDLAPVLRLERRDGAIDPHFWLDPERMITAAETIADALAQADPAGEQGYRERLDAVRDELRELDSSFRTQLSDCLYDSFVTGHAAFGYLADAYGLREITVAGIDPETEPSTAALAATREEIRDLGLPVVFAEPGDTKIAAVLAGELGIEVGVLDPVEAVGAGDDYLSLMYDNLDALKGGLACR